MRPYMEILWELPYQRSRRVQKMTHTSHRGSQQGLNSVIFLVTLLISSDSKMAIPSPGEDFVNVAAVSSEY
jgi:hypothetical protein